MDSTTYVSAPTAAGDPPTRGQGPAFRAYQLPLVANCKSPGSPSFYLLALAGPSTPQVTQRNPGSSRAPTIPPPSTNLSASHVCPFSLRKKGRAPTSCPSLSRARSCQAFPPSFGPLSFLTPVPFRNQPESSPREAWPHAPGEVGSPSRLPTPRV